VVFLVWSVGCFDSQVVRGEGVVVVARLCCGARLAWVVSDRVTVGERGCTRTVVSGEPLSLKVRRGGPLRKGCVVRAVWCSVA
jgi:hypothetical protein